MQTLDKDRQIGESINLGPGTSFGFQLKIESVDQPGASFVDQELIVAIPTGQAQQWIHSDQVGIEEFMPLEKGETLHILIEKDFPCKDRPDEDKSDTFQDLAAKNEDASC